MKENLIHLCFVIDESGSMYGSESDVIGGFNKLIEEQKAVENGECLVSVYRFEDKVEENFIGKDVKEIDGLEYHPGGCTALYDGVGTAIDRIGSWLSNMPEEERPSKNMIVIMTDGMENSSREYSAERVKDMIKHQEEKYNWTFVYMGSDITDFNDADKLGISVKSLSSKANMVNNYGYLNDYAVKYRCAVSSADITEADRCLTSTLSADTKSYLKDTKSE